MLRISLNCIWLVIIVGFSALSGCASRLAQNQINLTLSPDGQNLNVEYRSARPTTAITLARTPDSSRKKRWGIASQDFEVAQLDGKDVIRRLDGSEFLSVEVVVPATYVPLPKDYAPFSPFSDGGLLFHSGRFQACPSSLNIEGEECDGPWSMKLNAPPNAHIILNGEILNDVAQWSDSNDGIKIYVGRAVPRSGDKFVGIVDSALPPVISDLMTAALPKLMNFYSQSLPVLLRRPMLFVSYDPGYKQGHGRQGGTLPNQVFMHFYGPTWEEADVTGNISKDIVWFFAHEAGHIFQHGVTGDHESSWIHEGAAEAFAYLALRNLNIVSGVYLETRRQQSLKECGDALEHGLLTTAANRGRFSEYYHCGLIMFLAIDDKIRARSSRQQDIFDLWNSLIPESNASKSWNASTFLNRVEPWIGHKLARQLLSMATEKQVDPERSLAKIGN